ncbi:Lysophospholipid acyltransferase 2, partial [Eschrichtius robustus]|nr:Lysophospholipid acyltransferase 2 [Eschrichtius robustus]
MMIITQKITSLAYEIHDGMFRKDEELTPSQRGLAVRRMPSLLEYLSYNCNFMGILAGPLCSYKDYITFIEGRSYHMTQSGEHGKEEIQYEKTEPSPNLAVIQKLLVCGLSLLFHLTISKTLPVAYNIDEHFQATASWPTKVIYLYVSLLAARPKYYFAWTLADAINNAAGFGFRGYDKNGAARWDLISNLRIQQIEMSTSFKMFLDNWNIQTALWLKRVCYERTSLSPTIQTFILSAIWHGVYPGYYLTFLTGVVMTLAARAVRNNFRHHFIEPPQLKLLYDVITWIATQIAISYTVVPFVLLSIKPSLMFYSDDSHLSSHILSKFATIKRNGDVMKNQKLQRNIGRTTHHFLNNVFEMEKVTGCLLLESLSDCVTAKGGHERSLIQTGLGSEPSRQLLTAISGEVGCPAPGDPGPVRRGGPAGGPPVPRKAEFLFLSPRFFNARIISLKKRLKKKFASTGNPSYGPEPLL